MLALRLALTGLFAAAATAFAAPADAAEARAQGKLDARYVATLAGVPIGRGAWVIDVTDDQYTAAASGMTTGLLRVFASGQGSSASRGFVKNGALSPSSYASTLTTQKKTEELRILMKGGAVKEFTIDPPAPPPPDRVPLTDAHRRGVLDPMTAALLRTPGNGEPVSPEACKRTLSVFDGRMRFDLQFAFKRMETVAAERGYQGPAVVCAVYFTPVAGHVPHRPAINYLARQRDIEAWLVPVAGTRVLVPFRVSIPTTLGLGVLQATQFVTASPGPRETPSVAKTR